MWPHAVFLARADGAGYVMSLAKNRDFDHGERTYVKNLETIVNQCDFTSMVPALEELAMPFV